MKINGLSGIKPRVVAIYFMVNENDPIEVRLRPLTGEDEFEKVLSEPIPPVQILRGGERHSDLDNKDYKDALAIWQDKRFDWLILKSLEATEGLEFETVNMSEPETWKNWRTEFATVLGQSSVNKIINAFSEANSIGDAAMKDAKAAFLASRQPAA